MSSLILYLVGTTNEREGPWHVYNSAHDVVVATFAQRESAWTAADALNQAVAIPALETVA